MQVASTKADDVRSPSSRRSSRARSAPGTVLRQDRLSEQYGVSRTPIREALRRLAALGLVSFEPNRGVRVRTLTRAELREAFLIRAELESLATEIAAERMTRADLDELEAIEDRFAGLTDEEVCRGGRLATDRRADLVTEWVRANHAFHDVIYRVAALPMVERIAKVPAIPVPRSVCFLRQRRAGRGLYGANERQHRALLDALAAGGPSGARALAREHVLSSGALLERILAQQLGIRY